nr:uncharacterized protein LOC119624215 [Chlorocebus sabaeus]
MLQPGLTPLLGGLSRALGTQGLPPLANFLLGNRGLDAHINLSLHLRSEEAPLEETEAAATHESRSGGYGSEPARERVSSQGRKGESSEGRREGRTGPKTSPPRGSCRPAREHRSVTRDAAEERREPPKGLSWRDSHRCPEGPRTESTLAPAGLHMLRALERSKAVAVGRGRWDARLAGRAGLRSGAAAALPGKAALAAGLGAGEDRLRPARLRRALTAGAAPERPLVHGAPISGRGSHCKEGVASTLATAETLGPRLAASTKRAGGRSAALLRPRASRGAHTPASLKPSF